VTEYNIFQGGDIVVTLTLKDVNGSYDQPPIPPIPIPNENISCTIKNSSGATIFNTVNRTNDDGIASVNLTNLNLSVSDYTIHWNYYGSDQYLSASPRENSTLKVVETNYDSGYWWWLGV
jgi:hypothetical protein